jgi:putative endonuclease
MPFMYILKCSDDTYYTGSTWNLEKRLYQHQEGTGANYTSKRLPVELIYFEECNRIDEAFYREKQIQGWSHAKKKALIEKNYDRLHELAKCLNETSSLRLRSGNDMCDK